MGFSLLGDVLRDWSNHELDDSIYLPRGAVPAIDLPVSILPFDPLRKRTFQDQEYFLGIEQIRDVIEGLEAQLGRTADIEERLRAVTHYARHDAFIEPHKAVAREERR